METRGFEEALKLGFRSFAAACIYQHVQIAFGGYLAPWSLVDTVVQQHLDYQ
jgi:hypothetical protein